MDYTQHQATGKYTLILHHSTGKTNFKATPAAKKRHLGRPHQRIVGCGLFGRTLLTLKTNTKRDQLISLSK
jgi:hypothetical protein